MKALPTKMLMAVSAFVLSVSAEAANVYTTSATSGKFSEIAWSPSTPIGGADVELVFTGDNFTLENDIDDFAFSKLNFSAKGTLKGKRLMATAPAVGQDAILYFGSQGAAITAPLYLAANLTVTNNLNPTISGGTKINGVDGDISGPGRLTFWCAHRLNAQGYISLFGHNTFSGGLDIELGNIVPTNVMALGTGAVSCTNVWAASANATDFGRLWIKNFSNVANAQTLTNHLYIGKEISKVSNSGAFQTDLSVALTLMQPLHLCANGAKLNAYGSWTFQGGIDAKNCSQMVIEMGQKDCRVVNQPWVAPGMNLTIGHQNTSNASVLRFQVAGNSVERLQVYTRGIVSCDVDNAFSNKPKLFPQLARLSGMIVELSGTEQVFGCHNGTASPNPLLLIRNSTNESATVTLDQSVKNRKSSLMTEGPMTFIKDGAMTLTLTNSFSVKGTLIVRKGRLEVFGPVNGRLADRIIVEPGAELDLGRLRRACDRLELRGGRIENGELVTAVQADLYSGVCAALLTGRIVNHGDATVSSIANGRAGEAFLPPTGKVFHLTFDSEEAILKDAVAGVELVVSNATHAPKFLPSGHKGGCAFFDGTGYLSAKVFPVRVPTGAQHYTVSAWIAVSNTCSSSGGWIGYGKAGTNSGANNFRRAETKDIWNYWYGNDRGAKVLCLADGNWHQVVGTWDGTTRKLFYDGVRVDSYDPEVQAAFGDELFWIGKTLNSDAFTGCIDEVTIYNRALAEAEVCETYMYETEVGLDLSGKSVTAGRDLSAEAVLYYPFASAETLCQDASGNNAALSVIGTGARWEGDSPFGAGGSLFVTNNSYLKVTALPSSMPSGDDSLSVCVFFKARPNCGTSAATCGYGEGATGKANVLRMSGATTFHNYWWGRDFSLAMSDDEKETYCETFLDGCWHSWVATYDKATHTRVNYIDGGHTVGSKTDQVPDITGANFSIGARPMDGKENFLGNIAEVAVFNRALTAEEVAQYHASGLRGGVLCASGVLRGGGTVCGDMVLSDGVEVLGDALTSVTGNLCVEGKGAYRPAEGSVAPWDFVKYAGELFGDSAAQLATWTVSGFEKGYVKSEEGVLRAYVYVPGFLLIFR